MAKARSQTENITIKKEEDEDCKPTLVRTTPGITKRNPSKNYTRILPALQVKVEEEDCKPTLVLQSVRTTPEITKRKPSKNYTRILPALQIKVEEDTDIKSLLKSALEHSKLSTRKYVSQEQINQVIDCVVNHSMSVTNAARKAKISFYTARHYYNEYKNDPEKKIPVPRSQRVHANGFLTQEQVENLIRYIVDDKMSIPKASAKANMSYQSGRYYYRKYLKDPDHAIPAPLSRQHYMQDQKNELIGYIVNDKMSIKAASLKAKMSVDTGRRYYHKYFDNQNPDIPTPSHINPPPPLTQEQKEEVVGYIVNDKMSINAAAKKTNISETSAGRLYRQYLKDNNMEIPVLKSKHSQPCTQEKKDQLISLIVDEKMSLNAAGKKLGMCFTTARRYYHQYLKNNNLPLRAPRYTQYHFDEFIGYIFDDKTSIMAASKRAKIPFGTAYGYLQRYLKRHNLSINTAKFTPDQIDEFIGSIVE